MAFGKRLLRCNLLLSLALGLGISSALAQAPSGQPIRIGQTLVPDRAFRADRPRASNRQRDLRRAASIGTAGLLGRPVEYVVLDDQSKPDVSRTLYERLITADQGRSHPRALMAQPRSSPRWASPQRYHKVFIENTLGQPQLATYEWHFSATIGGPDPTRPCRGSCSTPMRAPAIRRRTSSSSRANSPRR